MARTLMTVLALFLAVALGAPQVAHAQNVKKSGSSGDTAVAGNAMSGLTSDSMMAALTASGATELEASIDSVGEPEVSGKYQDLYFSVLFYKCEQGSTVTCEQVQFRASFEMDTAADAAVELMENWNREWVFGKAYTSNTGAMTLEHALYVSGGVTPENVQINAELWVEIISDFATHIGWN